MKFLLAFALTLALVACSSLPATQTQQIETACAGASTALKVLKVANEHGKLTPAQQGQVLSAAMEVAPVCTAATTPKLDDLRMQALLRAVALLQARAAGS